MEPQATAQSADETFRQGQSLYSSGNLTGALQHFLRATQLDPSVGQYHRSLGVTFWQSGDRQRGQQHLQQAIALDPADAQAHTTLSQLYLEAAQLSEAIQHARTALSLMPDHPEPALALAMALEADRQTEQAWALVHRVFECGIRSPRLAFIFARMAPGFHQEDVAIEIIEQTVAGGHIQHPRQEASLRYLAAQLHDRLGQYDQALAEARRAHQLLGTRFIPHQMTSYVDELIRFFTSQKLSELPRATHNIKSPVFIVGMPRSGSTLVEQILAAHPSVHAAGEMGWMFNIARKAEERGASRGLKMPQCLAALSQLDIDELASQYLQPLVALNPAATKITDKNLANFLNLGLIQLLIPQARIIHCRRDPLDTCISCYLNEFVGYDFGLELETVGHFYKQYQHLMTHWPTVLDLPILDVDYENVVEDLEGQARRLLEFLELPWDPRCVEFHESRRFIGTASNRQVREPLYKSSVQRWRHYEKHLPPLRAMLGDLPKST